jgi:ubiquinone/menaquinone biosynthesis C-methylase UbiE
MKTNQEPEETEYPFDAGWRRWWYRLVRFGFHLLYNEMAWSYDSVSWLVSLGRWREWQYAALPFIGGPRVLELAHGPGHMLIALNRQGYQVYGVDRSQSMGRLAWRRVLKSGTTAFLTRGDARSLPYAEESFDSILSTFPTEFIVQEASIISINSILKPGGCMVIVPESRLKRGGPIRRFLEWLYAITGQRIEPADKGWLAQVWLNAENQLLSAGYVIDIRQVDLDHSEVTVIVATKPAGRDRPADKNYAK